MKAIVPGFGGCYATDLITVGGMRIGYMYREAPDFGGDSGWRFFSGTETQDYVDDPRNTEIYDVNTIANYDPDIVALLDAATGSAFVRSSSGEFVPDVPPGDDA